MTSAEADNIQAKAISLTMASSPCVSLGFQPILLQVFPSAGRERETVAKRSGTAVFKSPLVLQNAVKEVRK